MKLIDKSALVAEIDKRKNLCEKILLDLRTQENKDYYQGKAEAYSEMAELINTLEVKEVDFERELSKYVSKGIHRFFPNEGDDYYNMDSVVWQDYVIETAKHFFELGMTSSNKAQKGEKV